MRVLIAAAWPYASGPRHLGHVAGAYLPADVCARYHRLAGDDVLFVSGSDQHGTPITVAAERAGVPVERFAREQHRSIAASFARLGISFDHYGETATPGHAEVVHRIFLGLHGRGFVEERTAPAAWCEREARSLPDRYVEGGCPRCDAPDARGDQCDACGETLDPSDLCRPRCARCGARAAFRDLRQLFLRLDLLQPEVERFLDARAGWWRPFVEREARGWVRAGLRPRAITRDLDWGVAVPLPGWDERRLYVWFEAVCGYVSASVAATEEWRAWWEDDGALHRYFIGKDNAPFHAVWWPAILAGSGERLHLPDDVVASHYLTLGDAKLSASRGRSTTLDEALDAVGADVVRHALCALSPETADVELRWDRVEDLTRTGLLGAIANPAHRVATLVWKRFGGTVGEPHPAARARADAALGCIGDAIRAVRLREALAGVWELGRAINRALAEREPWHLPDPDACAVLADLLPLVDALGVAAWPIVPGVAERIRATLGREPAPRAWALEPSPTLVPAAPVAPLARP